MQLKEKKAKRKVNKVNLAAIIVSVIALLGLFCVVSGVGVIFYLLKDKPKLDLEVFNSTESTIVYDRDENQIYELGTVIRQNVEYEDLPTSLIDAFVAVEDSRFYEHNGFDVPRFAKAFLSNLKTLSFSQGGSTFTMQLVKNTYFVNDESGQGAVKSIKRKVQEIALAMELERKTTKKEIFINYLNKLNFGGSSQNIRGVQKASQYYFGKDVNELTLPESAMLAGVVNAPNLFNPFNYLDYAQERRDEVLYLMNYHGYITDNEYESALATRVEDFLVDSKVSRRGNGEGTPYQAYVDYVVEEVYNLTGLDPYTTPMRIHTCMDSDIQTLIDNIEAGVVDDYFEYPDDEFEVASLCINNQTGEIMGILGGRNYADGGSLLLNHATDQYKQPGSSIKPVLDYVQAFEVLGWSTSHIIVDKPLTYLGTDYIISNATNKYEGEISLKYAVGMSLNTPAIQTIRELIDAKGNAYLVDYLTSMGYDIDLNDFDEQYGIGGKGLNVSCLQMAGAYAALMNGGYYTTPHAVTKIEFLNEKAPIIPTYQSKQTVSEQACYLMSELLKNNVEGGYGNLMGLFRNDNYKVYAKTGTTNWGSEGAQFNVPNGSIKDGWVVGCTSEYSVATWMGYEKGQIGKPSYMTYDIYNRNIKGKITKLILDELASKYGYPEAISRPSGITSITHITKAGTPYVAPIEGIDEEYLTTGLIKSSSKYVSLASPKTITIANIEKDPKVTLFGTDLRIEWPEYPDKDMLKVADDDMDITLFKSDGEPLIHAKGNRMFDYTWVYGSVKYRADIYMDDKLVHSVTTDEKEAKVDIRDVATTGSTVKACAYYGFEKGNVTSNQRCISETLDDTVSIQIPALAGNAEDMYSRLYALGYPVEKSVATATSGHNAGTYTVYMYAPDLVEIPTNQFGSAKDIHSLSFKGFKIVEYVEADATISLTYGSVSGDDSSYSVNVQANTTNYNKETYYWSVDGGTIVSGDGTSSITVEFTDSCTVKVTIDYRDKDGYNLSDSVSISKP